ISSNNCGAALSPGDPPCTISVVFQPATIGVKSGTLTLNASPGGPVSVALGGTAVTAASLTITPTAPSYGTVQIGSTPAPAQTFTVTNMGGATTGTITTAISGSTEFAITTSTDTCKGKTLITGGTCTLSVVWTPVAPPGMKTATLTVSANPGGSPTASLSGTSFTPAKLALSPSPSFDYGNVP